MTIVRRLFLGSIIGVALARAALYLSHAAATLPSPLETYYLEAKMVLLAYRAQIGVTLYPAWQNYPYLADFFGPVYFVVVGLIGRVIGADFRGLFLIGRTVSFITGMLTSLLVGLAAARSSGRMAGLAGGLLSLTTASVFGFSVMTRPDVPAEFLGVAGYFLACGRHRATRGAGVALLVLAALTKQTILIFLVAAALGWACAGHWRRGGGLLVGGLALLGTVVGLVTLLVEPSFAASLLGESKTPWDRIFWTSTLERMYVLSPESFFFALLGLLLWITKATGRRDPQWAVLAVVILGSSLLTSAKRGSDLNYYLSLRVVEGLAVAALFRAWALSMSWIKSAALAVAAGVGIWLVLPGVEAFRSQANNAWARVRMLQGSNGRAMLSFNQDLRALVSDPRSKVLTDSGLIDLYRGTRADFGDPWLFRMLTETGRIDPVVMRERIDAQYYDLVITTSEIDEPGYATYDFGLPMTLAERVNARYVRFGVRAMYFLYRRRTVTDLPPGPARSADLPPRFSPP